MTRNPFDEIERVLDRMSRQFEGIEEDLIEGSVAVDLEDAGDEYVLTADLPGFETDDIEVELSGETVTVSADRETDTETEDEDGRYLRRERRRRSVSRSIRLPEAVDETETEAEYRNGVLTVNLPKLEAEGGRTIPVE